MRIDNGQILESTNFGQSWQPIIESSPKKLFSPHFLNFDRNMGVSLSQYNDFFFSTDSGEIWRFIPSSNLNALIKPAVTITLNYDINSGLYLISDNIKKIIPTKDSFQFKDVNFRYKFNPIICDNVTDKGIENTYVIGVLSDSFYLFKSEESGNLTRLFATKDLKRNGNRDRLVIQNNRYVVFCAERNIYAFEKKTGRIEWITNSLYNSVFSLEFVEESKIIALSFTSQFVYDFNTKESVFHNQTEQEIESYGIFRYLATNGKGEIRMVNLNVLYQTNSKDLEQLDLDQSLKSDSYLELIRYWNGHYWVGTTWNLYKNESPKATPKPCFDVQSVWPNPFYEHFNFEVLIGSQTPLDIQLFNSLGQIVYQNQELESIGLYDFRLKLDHLTKGMYYLKIVGDCGSYTTKLIHH